MRIRMKETRAGSENGITVHTYEAGQTYNVERQLAEVFLAEGWAEKVETAPKGSKGRHTKMLRRAPEDK